MIRARRLRVFVFALVLVAGAARCGKKGPPLPPLRPVPAKVGDLTARRLGGDVHLKFTVPPTNQDGTAPADIARVEVYGLTLEPRIGAPATPLDDRRFLKQATLVGTVEVRPAPPPEEEQPTPKKEELAAPPEPPDARPAQGSVASVKETLTAATLTPVDVWPYRRRETEEEKPVAEMPGPLLPPVVPPPLQRLYVAVGVSTRAREGPPSERVLVAMTPPPPPPSGPLVGYDDRAVTIAWSPPVGARRRVQDPAPEGVLASRPVVPVRDPYRYNVYEVPRDDQPTAAAPTPLNASPLDADAYEDARMAFDVERCYAVRTVETLGELQVESAASPPTCVRLADTFPPAAPKSLAAVASEGTVSLIWEANTDTDLAGYLVLRGEAPGEKLQPLMTEPIGETTYRDTTVRPGVRYVYAVVAVDTATPPNVSAQSNRVEAVGR